MNTATEADAPVRATGIDAIFFSVTDVPRALRFYRELLDIRDVTFEGAHGAEYTQTEARSASALFRR